MNTVDEAKAAALATALAAKEGTHNDEAAALLLGGAAINLAIIADAVSKLQAGMNGKPKDAPLNLRDLTDEERRVIEALRVGDLKVVRHNVHGREDQGITVDGAIEPKR